MTKLIKMSPALADDLSRFSERCTQAALEAFQIYGIIPYQGSGCLQIFDRRGFKLTPVNAHGLTMQEFEKEMCVGIDYFIITQGHAMSIRDGILIDTELKGFNKRVIQNIWEVELTYDESDNSLSFQ
jgi:hypothetical protein